VQGQALAERTVVVVLTTDFKLREHAIRTGMDGYYPEEFVRQLPERQQTMLFHVLVLLHGEVWEVVKHYFSPNVVQQLLLKEWDQEWNHEWNKNVNEAMQEWKSIMQDEGAYALNTYFDVECSSL